jgi:hypothetical protein
VKDHLPDHARRAVRVIWVLCALLYVNWIVMVARFQPNVMFWDQWEFYRPLFQGEPHPAPRCERRVWLALAGLVVSAGGWALFMRGYVFQPAVENYRFPWTPASDYLRFISLMLNLSAGELSGVALRGGQRTRAHRRLCCSPDWLVMGAQSA